MNFVLDASVTLAWCFEDERAGYAMRVLDELSGGEAIVSSLWPIEVTNGLASALRQQRMDLEGAAEARNTLAALPIVVEPVDRRRAFEDVPRLARAHGLTTYDASYLEVAVRLGIPLATLDRALARAAADEGVPAVG
jgi:predicted nucleic acid-binding protein